MKILVLGIAVAAAVGAVALVRQELDRVRLASLDAAPAPAPAAPQETPKVDVLVAARSLKLGTLLGPDSLEWRSWPEEFVSEVYITREASPEAIDAMRGSLTRAPFAEGEPLLTEKVMFAGDAGFMAAMLRPNLRAFAIRVRFETGVGGFVVPGDLVDIILTRRETIEIRRPDGEITEKDALLTDTLLENVRVLAIDAVYDTEGAPTSPMDRTATVEITPFQAEVLSLAEEAGRLTLALRPVSDLIGEDGERLEDPLPSLAVDRDTFDPIKMAEVFGAPPLEETEAPEPVVEAAIEPAPRAQPKREITYFRWNRKRTEQLP